MTLILTAAMIGVASLGCDGQHAKQLVAAPACPTAPAASAAPMAPAVPAVLHKASFHPGPEAHEDIETIVLNKSGKSVSLMNNGDTFVLYVDGEKAAEFVGGNGESLYQIMGSDGHDMGMIKLMGDSAMFSEDGDFGFDFDVDVEFDDEIATAPEGVAQGFFRAQVQDSGTPKVMMGVVMGSDAPRAVLRQYGLESGEVTVVNDVIKGLPAYVAGLKSDDVIVRVDGLRPADQDTIRKVLRKKNPGDTLALRVIRGNDLKELELHLTPYKREALDGTARLEIEEQAASQNSELMERVEALRNDMERLGEQMSRTRDSKKLGEMGARMGRLGAELGMLTSKLAMQEIEMNRQFFTPAFPNAPKQAQVVVPQWNGDGENRFRFLTVPGEGQALDELREIIARVTEESELHSERYQERLEEATERLAERTERQAERMQEKIERLVERMASEQDRRQDIYEEREDHTESLSDRLEEMDARMARLEEMIAQLLKDRR